MYLLCIFSVPFFILKHSSNSLFIVVFKNLVYLFRKKQIKIKNSRKHPIRELSGSWRLLFLATFDVSQISAFCSVKHHLLNHNVRYMEYLLYLWGDYGTNVYCHRPEVVLRLCRMCGERTRPPHHQSGRGRQQQDRKNHLSGGITVTESIRHWWTGTTV